MTQINIPDIIKSDLKQLGYPRLFGSRSMAVRPAQDGFNPGATIGSQITTDTDWDFSSQYTEEAHRYLVAAGFTHYTAEAISPYADDLTTGVYIKEYVPHFDWKNPKTYSINDIVKVNIILHIDEPLFRQVWDSIGAEFYYRYLWKRSPYYDYLYGDICAIKMRIKDIMNQLYATARQMR